MSFDSTETKLHITVERRTVLACTFGTLQYCTLEYSIYCRSIADAITGATAAATTTFIVVVAAYDAVAAAIVAAAIVAAATAADAIGRRVCLCVHVCVGVCVYIDG